MAKTVTPVAQKRLGWTQKASRVEPNEDSLMDKKQKRITD